MNYAVQVGKGIAKVVMVGMLPLSELMKELRAESISINARAQRSLIRGRARESTKELLADDRVHNTPRMKEFVRFMERMIEFNEKLDPEQGFLGAIQLVVPDTYKGATVRFLDAADEHSGSSALLNSALSRGQRIGTFRADPELGQQVAHIGDGQGRALASYSLERVLVEQVNAATKAVRKRTAAFEDAAEEERVLEIARSNLERARKFLSNVHLPFVLYAREVTPEGRVIGLDERAERRLYIEGNALNSLAGKEEVLKFERFSPVVTDLQILREEPEFAWMSGDHIEEDSKSVAQKSPKLFTLSALVQAYSLSTIGSTDATDVYGEMFEEVAARREFVHAYWAKVTEIFGDVWCPQDLSVSQRQKYLQHMRESQNVLFSGVFVLALGHLGHRLGLAANWRPETTLLRDLERLRPKPLGKRGDLTERAAEYRAASGSKPLNGARWTTAMMKPRVDRETGRQSGFAFNNTHENVVATSRELARLSRIRTADDDS